MKSKSWLEKVGFTPRDVILIVFIVVNLYLVSQGHQALDNSLIRVNSQAVHQCLEMMK